MKSVYTFSLVFILFAVACTKADYGDDFKPSPPPPIGNYTISDDVARDARVAKWSFEDSFTDSLQQLAGANSAASFAEGLKGKGYKGNDVSYVTYKQPGTIPSLQEFTVSFWMNAIPINGLARGIFSLNNKTDFWGNLDIYLDNPTSPDSAHFKVHIGSNVNGANIGQFAETWIPKAFNKWMHIAITYSASTSIFNIYANSQAYPITVGGQSNVVGPVLYANAGTNTKYGPLDFAGNNATAVVLGTWQFQPNDPDITSTGSQSWAASFAGVLDEFRIYNRALTPNEVNALFRLEKLGL